MMADQRTMVKLLRAPTESYAEAIVLDTFYNALNPADQDSLNSTVGGKLLERRTQDVLTIIENKSKVRNSLNKSIVSQVKLSDGNSSSSFEIAKLTHAVNQQTSDVTTAMTAILKQFQATPPPASVKAVVEICFTCDGAHPYYQCHAADGNTFPEFRDNIQGYVSATAVNYNQDNSGYLPLSVAHQIRPPGFAQPNFVPLMQGPSLSASINLMPLSVWKKLGLPELISTRMTIELANQAICTPAGIARDVFVPVRKFTFPADFVIVDYERDPRVPLILGRPFLRTTRGMINVYEKEMILRDGDERLTLSMRHDTSSYSNQPHKESINMINIYNDSYEDYLEDLFTTNYLSGNPTFSSHTDLTSPDVINQLSGSTSSSSPNHLLEERTQDMLTIINNKSRVCNSRNKSIVSQVKSSDANSNSSSFEIAKLTHAVNQQTSAVTTAMTAILKQFQATPPPASVKAFEEISAVNYNQGNSGYHPWGVANQIGPPGFAQPNMKNNQNQFGQPQGYNQGNNFNQYQSYQAPTQQNQVVPLSELEKIKRCMRTRSSSNLVGESSPNLTTSNPKRRNHRHSKQPFILEESLVDMMADQRTMAKLLRAPTESYAEAIVVQPILAEHFELKHSLINMMTSDQFFGLEKDNPRDHIRWFNKITSTIKYKDVPNSLDTFYNALNPADQDSLNSTIGGNLLERRTQDVLTIIENKSKARNSLNKSIVSQVKSSDASVKAVEEICFTCDGAHPYYQCHAADGNTFPEFRDNIQGYVSATAVNYNQDNSGYLPLIVPLSELEKIKKMNEINIKAMQTQINNVKNELRNEMKTSIQASMSNQTNELKNMMASFFQMNTASTSGSRPLPRNTIANSKCELKAITTRSGLVLYGPSVPMPPPFINPEEDERA
nr:reverse transcriptase domain-containing protein [Tanacetum cinerariifolium]